MSEFSESDSTDTSQSSTCDSGINTSTLACGETERNPAPSGSDVLAELFQSQKKLKEAETQVRSLGLILQHDKAGTDESSAGINLAVFRQNKSFLEEDIMKIRKDIYDKESFLQQSDLKLFEQYSDSVKDNANKNEGGKVEENDDMIHLNEEISLPTDTELTTSDFTLEEIKNHCCFSDKDEITKLRRALTETKQKHKEERDEIMKQLKALQVTTVNCETNWRCVVREKQLKIDDLAKKNTDLQNKHEILNACEQLKQKEAKENERKKKKDEKVITSLRKQNTSINKERKQLQTEVKELTNINQESKVTVKQLTERNKELEKCLCDKNQTLNEKNNLLQEYSSEIKKTNTLVNKLIIDINVVNTEKVDLSQQLELATNTLREEKLRFQSLEKASDNKTCVDVGIQTEESRLKDEFESLKADLKLVEGKNTNLLEQLHEQQISVERLRMNEVKLEKEWRKKSIENERTIQELTISLGMATAANELSCEGKFEEYRNIETKEQLPDCLLEVLEEIKMELNSTQEYCRKHTENVKSLHKNWRKYKSSVLQMNEELTSQQRNADTTFKLSTSF